jgi:hypothetical protein
MQKSGRAAFSAGYLWSRPRAMSAAEYRNVLALELLIQLAAPQLDEFEKIVRRRSDVVGGVDRIWIRHRHPHRARKSYLIAKQDFLRFAKGLFSRNQITL